MIYETRINLRNKTKEELIMFVNEGLETISKYQAELEKKDKVINEMAEYIYSLSNELVEEKGSDYFKFCGKWECIDELETDCKECIKEYFTNKVEREGK